MTCQNTDFLIAEMPLRDDHPVAYLDDQDPDELGRVIVNPSDGTPKLSFTGKRIGHISSRRRGSFRWTELEVYQTERNRFVCLELGLSSEAKDELRCRARVVRKLGEIAAIFEFRKMPMQLYTNMGIEIMEVP